jgi:hypothetical protein
MTACASRGLTAEVEQTLSTISPFVLSRNRGISHKAWATALCRYAPDFISDLTPEPPLDVSAVP